MNEDLMILRGRYVTLEAENIQLANEFKSFSRVIKTLSSSLECFGSSYPNDSIPDHLQESATAIQRLSELHKKITLNKNEMERLRPMTGL